MFTKVDHIAFAVANLKEGKAKLESMGAEFIVEKTNVEEKYTVAIYMLGDLCVSVLQGDTPDSFVTKHVETHGEGIQHIGIEVANLEATLKTLHDNGIRTTKPVDYGTSVEALVGPRYLFGKVLQLMEWIGEYKDLSQKQRMLKKWGGQQGE